MTVHQYLATGAWVFVVAFIACTFLQGLGQLVGFRNLIWVILLAALYYIGPFVLLGYTVWAFWPK